MSGLEVGLGRGSEEPSWPLLTPSPSQELAHPLATPVLEYDRQLSPSSVDTEASSCPAASTNTDFTQDNASKDLAPDTGVGLVDQGMEASSSSSSCSVMQESTSSAQLLNSRNYLSLATDANCQENGGIKGTGMVGLTLGKATQEFGFTSWNWPLIRRCCFWGVASVTVACVCVIIGYITTIPTNCDPPRAWYQGSLIYQVFPASFQDTDGNGVGDLRGLASRLDYVAGLGARGLRLSYVFQVAHFPEEYDRVTNLSRLEPALGRLEDFRALAEALHRRNISLILDLPLFPAFRELKPADTTPGDPVEHLIVNNHILVSAVNKSRGYGGERGPVTDVMAFWLDQGVDGFYLLDLDKFVNDDNFLGQIEEWREELNRKEWGGDKILVCSEEVLKAVEEVAVLEREEKRTRLLAGFDLVELRLDPVGLGARGLGKVAMALSKGPLYGGPGPRPWPLWSLAGLQGRRLASRAFAPNLTIALTLTSLVLPGSASILYGDEIGLQDIHDPEGERRDLSKVHNLGPMWWGEGGGFTRGGALAWLPPPAAAGPSGVPGSHSPAATLSHLKATNPPLYMHGLWNNAMLVPNIAVRYVDNEVLTIERSYPRRHSFLLVANLSPKTVTRDLSKLYYGGTVELDTAAPPGRYITFQSLTLGPGHAILAKLDK